MDNWLKALIAGACAVIIAGGAYFGWSEYRRASYASSAAAEKRSQADEENLIKLEMKECEKLAEDNRRIKSGRVPIYDAAKKYPTSDAANAARVRCQEKYGIS